VLSATVTMSSIAHNSYDNSMGSDRDRT